MKNFIYRTLMRWAVRFTDVPPKADRKLNPAQYTAAQRIDAARRKPSIKRSITK